MFIKSVYDIHIKLLTSILFVSFCWGAELNNEGYNSIKINKDSIFAHNNQYEQTEQNRKSKSPVRTLEKRPTVIFSKSEELSRSLSLTNEQKTFSRDLIITKPYYSRSSPPSPDRSSKNTTKNTISFSTSFTQNSASNPENIPSRNTGLKKTTLIRSHKSELRQSGLTHDRKVSEDRNSLSPNRSSSSVSQYSSEPNSSSSSTEESSENDHSSSEEEHSQNEFQIKIPRSLDSGISLTFNISPSKKPTSLKIAFILYDDISNKAEIPASSLEKK